MLARAAGEGASASVPSAAATPRTLLEATRARFAERARAERGRRARSRRRGRARGSSADPLRLRQALGNLVDNALRHGAGDVLLSARRAGDVRGRSRSPTGRRVRRPSSRRRRVRALRARRRGPHAAAAPGSGSRSCGRSPRRTAAAPSIGDGPGAAVRLRLPSGRARSQGHLSDGCLACVDDNGQPTTETRHG